jgi:hypothetical protein
MSGPVWRYTLWQSTAALAMRLSSSLNDSEMTSCPAIHDVHTIPTPFTETSTNMLLQASHSAIEGLVPADPNVLPDTPCVPTTTNPDRPPRIAEPVAGTDVPTCAVGPEVTSSSEATKPPTMQFMPRETTMTTPDRPPSTSISRPKSTPPS